MATSMCSTRTTKTTEAASESDVPMSLESSTHTVGPSAHRQKGITGNSYISMGMSFCRWCLR